MTGSRWLALVVGIGAVGLIAYFTFFQSADTPPVSAPPQRTETAASERTRILPSAAPSISPAPTTPATPESAPAATSSAARPGSLVGRVLDETGAPLPGTKVGLFDGKSNEGATPIATDTADDSGRFRFAGRAAGDGLAIRIEARDFLPEIVEALAIRAGEETDAGDRRLRPGARLSGVVVDAEGAPIVGAEIRYWAFVPHAADEAPHVTDAVGHFRMGGLGGGTYGLNVEASGFAPGFLDDITVKADQEVSGLRIVLQRGLSISGRVIGPDGNPVAAARVRYSTDMFVGIASKNGARSSVETDVNGRFELRDVPALTGRVSANAAGFADASVAAAGGASDVLISLVRRGSIHGRVVDASSGAALATFHAWAESRDSQRMIVFGGSRVEQHHEHDVEVEGSTDGTFTIDDLNPGTYVVHAIASGFAEGTGEAVTVTPAPDVAEAQISLVRGGSIRGIVIEEGTNDPIAGAMIRASLAGKSRFGDFDADNMAVIVSGPAGHDMEELMGSSQASAKTGDDGRFALEDLPAGKYRLKASHPDHANADVPKVEVGAGETAGPITITLGAAGGIEGSVSDVDRAPAVGARVSVRTIRGFSRSATTGDDGHYTVRNLAPGTYYVQRDAEASAATFMAVTMVGDGDGGAPGIKPPGVEVKVVANQIARVDFSDADLGAVAGRVLDGMKAVEGATVELTLDGQFGLPKMSRTDAEGRYDFDRLDPGAFVLAVRLPPETRELVSERVSVTAGRRIEKDLTLPSGSIEGVVVDAMTRRGLEGALVKAESLDGAGAGGGRMVFRRGPGGAEGITTDRDGKFRIPYLATGKYRVSAAKDGYGQDSKSPIELSKAGDRITGIEVPLGASGTLDGQVVDAETGTPIEHATIQGRDSSGSSLILSDFVETDSSGRFRVGGVRPGACSLTAFAMGYQPWSGDATISERGDSSISIPLQKNR